MGHAMVRMSLVTAIEAPGAPLPAEFAANPLAAMYGLASLHAAAESPADLLRCAAAFVMSGAGCAFAAIVLTENASTTFFSAGSREGISADILDPDADGPLQRALQGQRDSSSQGMEAPAWIAIPLDSGDVVLGALIAADTVEGAWEPDREFFHAAAALIRPLALRAAGGAEFKRAASGELAAADIGALFESMLDPVALIGTDGSLRLCNGAYRKLLDDAGLLEGPISAHPEVVMRRDSTGRMLKDSERALAKALDGHGVRAERVLRMADGRERVFLLSTSPVQRGDGTLQAIAAVWRDVTEQIARERALRLMQDVRRGLSLAGDLRHAARSVCRRAVLLLDWVDMAAVYALDGDDPVLRAQSGFPARASRLLASLAMGPAHRATAAVMKNQSTIFQTDHDEPATEASRRFVAASGAATFVNLPLIAGTQRFGLLVLAAREPHVPSRDELALLEAMAAQVGAELEGVRRRQEAENERARLQAVLDQLPEGVLLFDAGGRLVMSNNSSESIVSQPIDPSTPMLSLAGRYGFARADGRPYHHGDDPLARAFSTGLPVLGEEQIVRRADGRDLPVVANVAPIRDASGQLAAVIMVFQDITSLREMDRLKDDFLSIAGHELRTPITTIRGLAQLVERRRHRLDEATINAALTTINEQTDQMGRLVDELLDVSRIRTGRLSLQFAPFELAAALRSMVERLAQQRSGAVRLAAPEALEVVGDPGRLQQVFSNLLDNAVKYSEPQTDIDVTVRATRSSVTVEVRDRGLGVPSEALSRLFERFYRAENASERAGGLGLGLYLCREIVERHGGSISVASTVGEGTTFTVKLPRQARSGPND